MKRMEYYGHRRNRYKGIKTILIWAILIGGIAAILILFGVFRKSSVSEITEQPLSVTEMQALIPKGKELALAGDCFGCHSRANGEMGAGGVPIATPFGTVYSTNITPDKTFGIGNYTRADFHRALKDGIGKEKGNLYPAMPFVFTHITTESDLDALYAYMMSIPAMEIPNAQNTGVFAWPVRPFMNFWTLLNFPNRDKPNDEARSGAWNRGAYLVEGLAHCGACHSPRNFMMGVKFKDALAGGFEDGMAIPDITAEALSKHGYNLDRLTEYLATGISPEGTSFAGMNTVTHFSTSQMDKADVKAMATYLLTDRAGKLLSQQTSPIASNQVIGAMKKGDAEAGYDLYMSACASCHGIEGQGIPNVVPALKGNAIVAMTDPQTLVAVVLNGLSTTTYTNGQRMYAMPAYEGELTSKELADLLTWVRAKWGGISTPVSQKSIAEL